MENNLLDYAGFDAIELINPREAKLQRMIPNHEKVKRNSSSR